MGYRVHFEFEPKRNLLEILVGVFNLLVRDHFGRLVWIERLRVSCFDELLQERFYQFIARLST